MKKIVILNFTGLRGNWGCQATSFELLKFLSGIYPDNTPLHFDFVPLLATTKLDAELDDQLDRIYQSFEDVSESEVGSNKALEYLTSIVERRYAAWLTTLREADLVVFQAEGSMGMGEDFAKGPRLMVLPFVAKHAWNRTVIAMNQSFYSQNPIVRRNAAITFKSLDFCAFRESLSLAFARENGVKNACLIPDLAFMARSWDTDIKPREKPPTCFAITGSALKDPRRYEVVIEQTKRIAKNTGLSPVVAVSRDYQLTLASYLQLGKLGTTRIPRSANYVDVTKQVSENAFLIGGRYHMAILAAAALTPSILFQGNSFKNEGVSHLLGDVRSVRGFSDNDTIMNDIDVILNNFGNETNALSHHVTAIRNTIRRAQMHLREAILGGGTFAFDDQLPVFQRPIEGILEQYKQYGAGKRKKRSGLRLMVNELSEKMSADDDNKAAKRVVASCIESGDREFEPVQKQL